MSTNYDSDEYFPLSPGLKPVRPRATPSPTPPPVVTHHIVSTAPNVSPPSSRRRKKSNRRKARPSQGDSVLLRVMEPNRPDIAREAGERVLGSGSGSEVEDDDMDERSPTAEASPLEAARSPTKPADCRSTHLAKVAQVAQDVLVAASTPNPAPQPGVIKPPPPIFHRDSVVELDGQVPTHQPLPSGTGTKSNGSQPTNGADHRSPVAISPRNQAASPAFSPDRRSSTTNGYSHVDSLATSPRLRELTISTRSRSPSQKLPALQTPQSPPQDGSAASPSQNQQLPSFQHISNLAQTALQEQERANFPHRQSVSSTGQSPTSIGRQHSITSLSPGSTYAPLSASSSGGSSDMFLRAGQHLSLFNTARRPSQASESGAPYSAPLHSASTNDSYQEGLSPASQPTPIEGRGPRMSIGEALESRTLPPPLGPNIQHIPSHGSGGFKCEHPNCNAPPFQTQYLLNSHANVHSQTRPHFCPVQGCPRAEGGKGFKRKNEMIRHGLVHQSPGYVCPFCPDREHKYPRPDNLQRHVRVHHVDKDKDDPQLREVLAQRPEGGSRGRRRRAS